MEGVFQFEPGDVILYENCGHGLYRKIKEWLLKPYPPDDKHTEKWGHVAVFWGVASIGGSEMMFEYNTANKQRTVIPLQVEAIGRGTLKTDLRNEASRYIKVLRHPDAREAWLAALKAGEFARQGKRWYDYWCIVRYVLPFLFARRLFYVNWGFGYQRNEKFICTEQADAAYNYTLFDDNRRFPTLPGDYEYTVLRVVGEGVLIF